jgi:Ankyrin repeats (3 copies)/KH domain
MAATTIECSIVDYASLGDLQSVKRLLLADDEIEDESERRGGANMTDKYGDTGLHGAAAKNKTKVMQYLFSSRSEVNVNAQNQTGSTPLHKAALNNNLSAIRMLLEHGADAALENKAGMTAESLAMTKQAKKLFVSNDDMVECVLVVPESMVGLIVGRQFAKLKDLQLSSGATIDLPSNSSRNGRRRRKSAQNESSGNKGASNAASATTTTTAAASSATAAAAKTVNVKISGRQEAVDKARKAIMNIVRPESEQLSLDGHDPTSLSKDSGNDDWKCAVRLPIKKELHKRLIPREIGHIEDDHDVNIYVPPLDAAESNVVIRGADEDSVNSALTAVLALSRKTNKNNRGGRGRGRGRGRGGR